MEKVFIHDGRVAIYCNSNVMENLLRKRGDRELSVQECIDYGISGKEKWVTPQNTVVNEDGSIVFTPPAYEEMLAPVREDKIRCFDNAMDEIDGQLVRSISDLMVAMLVPAPIDATPDENTLEKSRNVLVSLWRAQEQNRALRAQVQTAQSVEEVQGIEPVTVDKGKLTAASMHCTVPSPIWMACWMRWYWKTPPANQGRNGASPYPDTAYGYPWLVEKMTISRKPSTAKKTQDAALPGIRR